MSLSRDPRLIQIAKQRCRELRKNQTRAEKIFWEAVRNRRFLGLKFNRQHPLFFDYEGKETFYIADFYCHEKKVVIELDGEIHDYQRRRDEYRTFIIEMLGIKVIRFGNKEIENHLQNVLERLRKELTD
ncbi:MAG: endonuclease domain-containing protein [Calditrichaeota bacterium]|nr:MAG: endonuclease domain-containing protein [Calditrichota bacterium]